MYTVAMRITRNVSIAEIMHRGKNLGGFVCKVFFKGVEWPHGRAF